jgi:hypothetical protein
MREAGDWGGIIYSPLRDATLKGYDFPDGSALGRFDYLNEKYQEFENTGRYIIIALCGLFDYGWQLRGFDNMLADFAAEESFVKNHVPIY